MLLETDLCPLALQYDKGISFSERLERVITNNFPGFFPKAHLLLELLKPTLTNSKQEMKFEIDLNYK